MPRRESSEERQTFSLLTFDSENAIIKYSFQIADVSKRDNQNNPGPHCAGQTAKEKQNENR